MHLRLLALLFVLGTSAALADQRLNVNVPGGGAQDLLNMTSVPSDISNSEGDPTMQRSCINSAGRRVRESEDGYRACLAQAQANSRKGKSAQTTSVTKP